MADPIEHNSNNGGSANNAWDLILIFPGATVIIILLMSFIVKNPAHRSFPQTHHLALVTVALTPAPTSYTTESSGSDGNPSGSNASPSTFEPWTYPPDGKLRHLDNACSAVQQALSAQTGVTVGCEWTYPNGPASPAQLTVHVTQDSFEAAHASKDRLFEIASIALADVSSAGTFESVPADNIVVDQ